MSEITKYAIANALKQLLDEKSFDKITVNDIAIKCGINRMTFYYHFNDIYDLLERFFEEEAKRVVQNKKTYSTWQEGLLDIFEVLKKNQNFTFHIYNSVNREILENYLYKITYNFLIGVITEEAKNAKTRPEDLSTIAHIYKYAFVGIILDRIKTNMTQDPKEIVRRFSLILKNVFITSISNVKID